MNDKYGWEENPKILRLVAYSVIFYGQANVYMTLAHSMASELSKFSMASTFYGQAAASILTNYFVLKKHVVKPGVHWDILTFFISCYGE